MKYRIERNAEGDWIIADVWKRGHAVLTDSLLNKGSAFTPEERALFELDGMLPFAVTDRARQQKRAYETVHERGDDPLVRYLNMTSLQDRNETLFYQVLAAHVEELLPIVYTPTVGTAAVKFSHVFKRGRGLWITPAHRGRIFEILGHARNEEVKLVVVTDNERILGLGDQGAGGMVIPIGKLSLYTLGAGIHPAYTLPISLDVGTDNENLLNDDLYVGWRHPRLRGEAYDEFIAEFVDAMIRRFPGALLQWEDFKKANAFRLLDRYRDILPSFNDDIQGTAAVVGAGIHAACRITGTKLADQRVVLVGAGAAGVGIARHLRHEMELAGASAEHAAAAIAMVDTHGFLTAARDDIEAFKADFAWPAERAARFGLGDGAHTTDVIAALHPTVLIGTTGQSGRFDEPIIRGMASHVDRPLVMALSNPTSKCEVVPEQALAWSEGRALVATGSPFEPVPFGATTIPISQCNNVYVFPGVGLGAIVAGATKVTDSMFAAAADALAAQVTEPELQRGMLYPPVSELRDITRQIAAAVARAAVDEGVATAEIGTDIFGALDREIWNLDYPILRPV
jgi:malic enzyme